MTAAKSLLGGLSSAQFLAEYWQRKPLLMRNALPDWQPPIDGDDLAGLACEELAESRLVLGPDANDCWQVEHGPFAEQRFAELPERNFSLLVQDVDKWNDDVAALLDHFDFIANWRIDDVMVSFAAPGGSVGPHCDHYDVFLLQASGTRRWQIDQRPGPDLAIRDGQDLKLLRQFTPSDDWLLQPGDILYLPPGVPHHGIAEDACLTYSIGMRAPSISELLVDFAESWAAQADDAQRLSDADRSASCHPAQIDLASVNQVHKTLQASLAANQSELSLWFADYMSRYRLVHPIAKPESPISHQRAHELARQGAALYRNPWGRYTFALTANGEVMGAAKLFACGECFDTSESMATLLCGNRQLAGEQLQQVLANEQTSGLLMALIAQGFWSFLDAGDQ